MGIDPEELMGIIAEISNRLLRELTTANRGGEKEIKAALKKWHYDYNDEDNFEEDPEYVLVIGCSRIEEKHLVRRIINLGLDPEKFDFHLEYHNDFDFDKLRNSTRYSDVIVGPMGHNQKGRQDASSMIEMMISHSDKYPNVVKCVTNGTNLKLTGQSFQDALLKTKAYGKMRAFGEN